MAPMYDEDEDIWTGAGLSKEIARQRLAERQNKTPEPSSLDRTFGALKGAAGGASTGASLGSMGGPMGTAIGTGIGALVGGIGGAVTAEPAEKAPTASQMREGMGTAKKAYDEYKKYKSPGLMGDLSDEIKDLSDLGSETGLV